MRSGDLRPSDGKSWYAGQGGYWWSSRGGDNVWGSAGLGSYRFDFGVTGVTPSNGPTYRYYGFFLRCLSTVLDM